MAMNRKNLVVFCITIFIGSGYLIQPAWGQLKLDPERVSWSYLSFHAKNFWVAVSTDIQMNALPASDLDSVLISAPEGVPIAPQTSRAAEIMVNTTIKPRFRSTVKIVNRIWFDPSNAWALGRVRLRRGEDDFKKSYRFTQQGVFRHRIEPEDKNEARLAPEKWTDIKDTFYSYNAEQLGCPVISERTVLIYIISAVAKSNSKTPLTICVFGKRQLHRVELRKAGTSPIKINYIEKGRQNDIRKEGTIQALKVVMSARSLKPHLEDAENFSFMGFHKDISVYIEPASGLPINVSGIIPTVGKVDLKLQEVHPQPSSNKKSNSTCPDAVAFH
jgi:hypothetical protein